MRRLYSTFADGRPGVGLFLLRLVLGSSLVVRASLIVRSDPQMNAIVTSVFLAGFGLLLLPGLWTPFAGTFIALLETWQIVTIPGDRWEALLLGTIGVALALLGPGLWSVDARLFGWKRMEAPPRRSRSDS